MFKPHAVQRGIVGEVLARFERIGLKIAGCKMLVPTMEQFHHHYETIGTMVTRHGQAIFDSTVAMMQEGPVIAFVLEGVEAVEVVRKMAGPTEPKTALPGTIRGDYSHMSRDHANLNDMSIYNIMHASGNQEEAKAEIAHWFAESEMFDYVSIHDLTSQKVVKK